MTQDRGRVAGKVAVVTGAALGIGQAAAYALAQEGAKVAIGDINQTAGEETAAHIQETGGEAFFLQTDVSQTAAVEALISATIARYGRLDILVNNAAIAIPGSVTSTSEEAWQQVLNTNLSSVYRGMRFAIPQMLTQGGGAIINVSSVQSLKGFSGWAAYAAAKGGINALTQQAATDYSPHNIRVNAVAPGTIMTPMNEKIFREAPDPQALIDGWNRQHALGRFGQSDEVAALILFLASDEASFITGEIIRVDGGLTIFGG